MDVQNFVIRHTTTSKCTLENVLNITALLNGIRTGAVLTRIETAALKACIDLLSAHGIRARRYPLNPDHVIVCVRAEDGERVALLDGLDAASPSLHTDTGQILGYLQPYNILDAEERRRHHWSIQIQVRLVHPLGTPCIVQMLPQRVDNRELGLEYLRPIAEQIARMPLPEKFHIEAVDVHAEDWTGRGGRRRTKNVGTRRRNRTRRLTRS
jgi:hypothetical protein